MNNFSKRILLKNYVLGICTPGEQKKVEVWLEEETDNISLLQEIAHEMREGECFSHAEKEDAKKQVMKQIQPDRSAVLSSKQKISNKVLVRYGWVRAAAIILIILTSGITGFYMGHDYFFQKKSSASPVMKHRTISYGQTATLRLGDGSVIKLNGGSTLRYPEKFTTDHREVYLEGEAFFSVAKDKSRPFIVHAGNITTRVLGTAFNIRAYKDEDKLQVALVEGKVSVKPEQLKEGDRDSSTVILEKNQWVTYHLKEQIIERGEGNLRDIFAWKDNVLVFHNKTLDQVAKMLERWYGIKVILEDPVLKNYVLEGEHNDVSLDRVLNSIQFALDIEYTMHDGVVRIRKAKGN